MADINGKQTEGRRRLSWIWLDLGISEDAEKDPGMHDGEYVVNIVTAGS